MVHEPLVLLALILLGPPFAAHVMVHADRPAETTRVGTLLHDGHWVLEALARRLPDLALRRIVVGALEILESLLLHRLHLLPAHLQPGAPIRDVGLGVVAVAGADATAERTALERVAGIRVAHAFSCPPGAVVLQIAADRLARPARHGAVLRHKLGILVALTGAPPSGALVRQVLALGGAEAAAGGADPQHRIGVRLALTILGPVGAGHIRVAARVRADAAGERARKRHVFRVLARALATASPIGAVVPVIVADATENHRDQRQEGSHQHVFLPRNEIWGCQCVPAHCILGGVGFLP